MPTTLEVLAGKALERARSDEEEEKRSPAMLEQALRMVKESPLGRDFPEVAWTVLDHNLNLAPHPSIAPAVFVEPDDDETPEVRVRLLVTQQEGGGPLGATYAVHAIPPGATAPYDHTDMTLILTPEDLGRWIERQRLMPFGSSVNGEVFESTTVVPSDA